MKRSIAETLLGAIVLLSAGLFLMYSMKTADITDNKGYSVSADFSSVGSLRPGDTVQISGVKVGTVSSVELLPESYLARVHLNIREDYRLPLDTAALITSEGLLGGQFMALEPGAEEDMIEADGSIQYTQAPQNLEQLLGQFIFSMQNDKDSE